MPAAGAVATAGSVPAAVAAAAPVPAGGVNEMSIALCLLVPTAAPVRAGQGKRGKNYFPSLPSIGSLRSKAFLKARTELFKAELVHLATRLSSTPTNDR